MLYNIIGVYIYIVKLYSYIKYIQNDFNVLKKFKYHCFFNDFKHFNNSNIDNINVLLDLQIGYFESLKKKKSSDLIYRFENTHILS